MQMIDAENLTLSSPNRINTRKAKWGIQGLDERTSRRRSLPGT